MQAIPSSVWRFVPACGTAQEGSSPTRGARSWFSLLFSFLFWRASVDSSKVNSAPQYTGVVSLGKAWRHPSAESVFMRVLTLSSPDSAKTPYANPRRLRPCNNRGPTTVSVMSERPQWVVKRHPHYRGRTRLSGGLGDVGTKYGGIG